jgi:hypothetical protein
VADRPVAENPWPVGHGLNEAAGETLHQISRSDPGLQQGFENSSECGPVESECEMRHQLILQIKGDQAVHFENQAFDNTHGRKAVLG